jgi:Flp pilus assembly pilin Flp
MYHIFNKTLKAILSFFNNERGVTSIEYALIAGLIVLSIIFSVRSLGFGLDNVFGDISNVLVSASGASKGDESTNSNNEGNSSNNSNGNNNNGNNNNNNSNGNNNSNNNGKNNSNGNN